AGTSYDTDREYLAAELGFSKISSNSMDAVSDRDFAIEFLSCASQCMMHLSRFCEEIIFWNTSDVGFIEIDDAFATGSSIMPQKKNPDMA
ncbi:lyase family protein, partial [Salmonella enterica subsp. enterica serovar 1,4,[5],12:i:-]